MKICPPTHLFKRIFIIPLLGFIILTSLIAWQGNLIAQFLKTTPGCIFFNLTGIKCPGCGGTRATIAFLEGRYAEVFAYNYLWIPTIFILIYEFVIRSKDYLQIPRSPLSLKRQLIIERTYLVIVILFAIIRNFFDF